MSKLIENIKKNPKVELDKLNADEIATIIQKANHKYYNTSTTLFSDDLYDFIKDLLRKRNPKHPILTHIGAAIDSDDTRSTKLPYYMGSLNKITSDNNAILKFKSKHADTNKFIISDKLNGRSGMLDIEKNNMRLYSRGGGKIAQDLSYIISFINGISEVNISEVNTLYEKITIRGEFILSKSSFEK